jgi:hypothetical protein
MLMAIPADDLKEFKLIEEEEKEIIVEWRDISEAINDLEELKNNYGHKESALKIVKLIESRFVNAHLWSIRMRLIAKALIEKSKTVKRLEVIAQRAANIANTTVGTLYHQVEISEELYSCISNDNLKEAEEQRQILIKNAIEIAKTIGVLRTLERMEKETEKHYF